MTGLTLTNATLVDIIIRVGHMNTFGTVTASNVTFTSSKPPITGNIGINDLFNATNVKIQLYTYLQNSTVIGNNIDFQGDIACDGTVAADNAIFSGTIFDVESLCNISTTNITIGEESSLKRADIYAPVTAENIIVRTLAYFKRGIQTNTFTTVGNGTVTLPSLQARELQIGGLGFTVNDLANASSIHILSGSVTAKLLTTNNANGKLYIYSNNVNIINTKVESFGASIVFGGPGNITASNSQLYVTTLHTMSSDDHKIVNLNVCSRGSLVYGNILMINTETNICNFETNMFFPQVDVIDAKLSISLIGWISQVNLYESTLALTYEIPLFSQSKLLMYGNSVVQGDIILSYSTIHAIEGVQATIFGKVTTFKDSTDNEIFIDTRSTLVVDAIIMPKLRDVLRFSTVRNDDNTGYTVGQIHLKKEFSEIAHLDFYFIHAPRTYEEVKDPEVKPFDPKGEAMTIPHYFNITENTNGVLRASYHRAGILLYNIELLKGICPSGECPPGPVLNATATVNGKNVQLSWNEPYYFGNPPIILGYMIRSGDLVVNVSETSFNDNATRKSYAITAYNAAGESESVTVTIGEPKEPSHLSLYIGLGVAFGVVLV
jgi:hypothetical protein